MQHCHAHYVGNGLSGNPNMGEQCAVLSALRNQRNKILDAKIQAKGCICALVLF